MPDSITVTSTSTERRSRRDQIDRVLARAIARQQPVRIRLPVTFYDSGESRGYVQVRDASWNLQLPHTTTAETIEELIQTLGMCIVAIAREGSQVVRERIAAGADHE